MSVRTGLSSAIYECLRDPVPMGVDAFRRGAWAVSPPMHVARANHTATRVGDDALLVAGGLGEGGAPTASAEIYDAYEQAWVATPPMLMPRCHHVAIALPNKRVMVLGGSRQRSARGAVVECEIYDPVVRKWLRTAPMTQPRARHAAALLRDGTVLVAGGISDNGRMADAELYDPRTDTWKSISPMRAARIDHALTVLDNGRVLATGRSASGGESCDIYEMATGRWIRRPSPRNPPSAHTATLLGDGRVLLVGGVDPRGASMAASDVFYPRWSSWGDVDPHPPCDLHAVVSLKDGGVALLGGAHRKGDDTAPDTLDHCAMFDCTTGSWSRGPAMPNARFAHSATLLPHCGIVVCGGFASYDAKEPLGTCDTLAPSWEGFSRVT